MKWKVRKGYTYLKGNGESLSENETLYGDIDASQSWKLEQVLETKNVTEELIQNRMVNPEQTKKKRGRPSLK